MFHIKFQILLTKLGGTGAGSIHREGGTLCDTPQGEFLDQKEPVRSKLRCENTPTEGLVPSRLERLLQTEGGRKREADPM